MPQDQYPNTEVPLVERGKTCMIVLMPRATNFGQQAILDELQSLSLSDPNPNVPRIYVLPYESKEKDMEYLWQRIQIQFGVYREVERLV